MTRTFQRGIYTPTRREALTLGTGLLGAAAAGWPRGAMAQGQPPLGTWPAGSQGSSVFVGISVPRTGTYAVPGEDEFKGYQLAIEHINQGHELIRKMAPKVTKGLLGKEVVFGVADSEAKPNVAVQNLSRFVSENKAVVLTGSCSS
ncbi:MAG TPA: ABC transporter substrate-binding protein, partial [Acetobacteraceae bacterium]|nr:ABC transporter substrate-binding protein [Acetobacteraceae bacterium]